MNPLHQGFAQVKDLLSRIVGVTPPLLLMLIVEQHRWRILGGGAPRAVHRGAVNQVAIGVPAQVDLVFAGRIIGHLFVLITH